MNEKRLMREVVVRAPGKNPRLNFVEFLTVMTVTMLAIAFALAGGKLTMDLIFWAFR